MNDEFFICELSEKYINQAAALLNSEWPRNLGMRCSGLKNFSVDISSSDQFAYRLPISLVLVSKNNDKVVGHVSLVSIATIKQRAIENFPFLQSLVIDSGLRGRGLGKRLVLFCENYIKEFNKRQENMNDLNIFTNCKDLYLTTKDQQFFYEKIGYVCTKEMVYFVRKQNESKNNIAMNLLMSSMQKIPLLPAPSASSQTANSLASPPPPPPFLQASNFQVKPVAKAVDSPTWYKKSLETCAL